MKRYSPQSLNGETGSRCKGIADRRVPLRLSSALAPSRSAGDGGPRRNRIASTAQEQWHASWLRLVAALLLIASAARADDWPQYLGPHRNGVYAGPPIATKNLDDPKRVLWKKPVGEGFAGPAVAEGRVIIFHRVDQHDVVDCLDAVTGETKWSFRYATDYRDDFGFDEGPRAVPTIDVAARRVYTHGPQGMLHCLDFADGRMVWAVDTVQSLGSRKGFFGRACSPLIEGDLLLLNTGGPEAGVAAFDKHTGAVKWKATDHEAGYASPVAATLHGKRHALFYTRTGLVGVTLPDGVVRFTHPWRARMNASVNAASPLVIDDRIFLSTSYGVGATLLQYDGQSLRTLWAKDDILSNHYATSVHRDGYLYGFDGRQETGTRLRCVELKTGNVLWSHEPMPAGTITLAGDLLLLLTEKGQLIVAPATPDGFKPAAEAQVLGFDTRAYPALADAKLYARDKRTLICLNMTP